MVSHPSPRLTQPILTYGSLPLQLLWRYNPRWVSPDQQRRCNSQRSGNTTEYCGGASVLNVYQKQYPLRPTTTKAPIIPTAVWTGTPTPNAQLGNWKYNDCVGSGEGPCPQRQYAVLVQRHDAHDGRAVPDVLHQPSSAPRRPLAGLQNGQYCYCGGALSATASYGSTCGIACTGNSRERCGDAGPLSIYQLTNMAAPYHVQSPVVDGLVYRNQGCYTNGNPNGLNGPHVSFSQQTSRSATGLTVESCIAWCNAQGSQYKYSGVIDYNECWCDTGVQATPSASRLTGAARPNAAVTWPSMRWLWIYADLLSGPVQMHAMGIGVVPSYLMSTSQRGRA